MPLDVDSCPFMPVPKKVSSYLWRLKVIDRESSRSFYYVIVLRRFTLNGFNQRGTYLCLGRGDIWITWIRWYPRSPKEFRWKAILAIPLESPCFVKQEDSGHLLWRNSHIVLDWEWTPLQLWRQYLWLARLVHERSRQKEEEELWRDHVPQDSE